MRSLRLVSNPKFLSGAAALILASLTYLFLPADVSEAARRMAFVFVLAAIFWSFETVPLHVTSILVVALQTFLLCRPGGVLGMDQGGYKTFIASFGDPVIILFMGGFILSIALQKFEIDKMAAARLLTVFGRKPYAIMIGFMLTSAFFSLWMSSTATTATMLAMVLPFLKQINESDKFRTGLILSIPFACSVGSIGTPIGTPPNAIAMGVLTEHGIYLDFFSWVKMALPLAVILVFMASGVLYFMFPPTIKELDLAVKFERTFDRQAKLAIGIAVFTVLLWLTSSLHRIPSAVVALLSMSIFLTTGLINKSDLKLVDWDILVLMWGGLALGTGMQISGLAHWLVGLPIFQQSGFALVVVFCIVTAVLTTFISNTATANLILPLVMVIPGENKILLAVTVALCSSLATAFPISTPPNAIAYATGMIRTSDMIKVGTVISVIAITIVLLAFKFVIVRVFGL